MINNFTVVFKIVKIEQMIPKAKLKSKYALTIQFTKVYSFI